MVFVFSMFSGAQNANSGNSRMMNFGKSRAKMSTGEDNKITLNDVAGLKEEKEQLSEIIEFLKNPEKFTKVGARIPKGVLLEGAPGTGKTLLARAVAGEAGVPFFSISGSDFVEMFVGVGASRVRDLFAEAKKNSPCIVFIDEIDAVARRRGTGMGGGHDEREQTLNQMLVEMDGFGVNEGIIVMAATNRVDILDPAILRPGRFDRKITVSRPDVGGREEILKVHARNKPLAEDVDIKQVAQTTAGFTGADLENLLNESAINAAVEDRQFIKQDDINKAFIQVGIGTEKHSRIISDKEKKITAYHETGHAILFHVLPDVGPVHTISIIPTGLGAAGYTMPLPEKDEMFLTKRKMLQDIMVSLGGRIAEEIIFGDITTGASSDIRKATQEARSMVTKYGMSDSIGVVSYDDNEEDVFIGYDISHSKKHSELVAGEIDKEVKTIIEKCYAKAKEIILKYEDVLHASADLLIEKEKIGREEFEALFEGHTITEDVEVTI
jgi:cell division protease FtsH